MTPEFRAWYKRLDIMLVVYSMTFDPYGRLLCIDSPASNYGADEVVMLQSTGIVDYKGQKIFEGDILNTHCFTHHCQPDRAGALYDSTKPIIRYLQKPGLEWWLTTLDNKTNTALHDYDRWDLEVIDNIYENRKQLYVAEV